MTRQSDNPQNGSSEIGASIHGVLRDAGRRYATLKAAILEQFANACDGIPTKEDRPQVDRKGKPYKPRIDILWNKKTHEIIVRDNGDGCSIERYDRKLKNTFESDNQDIQSKIGEFNLGELGLFGKCREWTVQFTPRGGENGPTLWTFNGRALLKQKGKILVPRKAITRGVEEWWNVEKTITDYSTKSKSLSAMELRSFTDELKQRYNSHLLAKGIEVRVVETDVDGRRGEPVYIKGEPYLGKPLLGNDGKVVRYHDPVCGTTEFRLFLATSEGRKKPRGRVVFMNHKMAGNLSPRPGVFGNADELMSEEVLKALKSGVLEGHIKFDKPVTLEPSRMFFETSDALVNAVTHVRSWYDKIGKKHVAAANPDDNARRAECADLANMLIENALKKIDVLVSYGKAFSKFGFGSVSEKDHVKLPGKQDGIIPAKRTSPPKGSGKPRSGSSRGTRGSGKEKKGDTPFTSMGGPGGQNRRAVKGHSKGPTIKHKLLASGLPWELDMTFGILTVNTGDATFVALESTKWTRQSQAAIAKLDARYLAQALVGLWADDYIAKELGTDPHEEIDIGFVTSVMKEFYLKATKELSKFERFLLSPAADALIKSARGNSGTGRIRRPNSDQQRKRA